MRLITPSLPAALLFAGLLLSGCGLVREARMAVPQALAAMPEERFGHPGWGRRGEFMLGEQSVRYERGADRLSLFDTLSAARAPLRYTLAGAAGAAQAECQANQVSVSAGALAVDTRPWTLDCRWSGASDATLRIGEGRVQWGQQTREGSYRGHGQVLQLRSVHRLEGSRLPLASAVGYELLQGERSVGSVDLSRGVPVLRRPDPRTPLGQAVTEAALALALVWEPA